MKRYANVRETVPQPCHIFGTSLRPFSLGHHLLFVRLGLPCADNPLADLKADDFLNAVAICANSYEGTLTAFESGEWVKKTEKWMREIKRKKPNMDAAIVFFQKHLQDGYRMAPVWRHVSKNTISMTAPWEQLLKCRLVMAGFSATDVLNGYMPALWYDYFTVMELTLLQTCESSKDWKSVFYTMEHATAEIEVETPPAEAAP